MSLSLTLTVDDDDIGRCGNQVATTAFRLVPVSPCLFLPLPTSALPVVRLRSQVSVFSPFPALFDFFACMFVDFLILHWIFVLGDFSKLNGDKLASFWCELFRSGICLIWSFFVYMNV